MRIVIVEDDYLQADALRDELTRAFPGAEIYRFATESEFLGYLADLKAEPDVLIMDVMLRWTNPDPEMQPPPEEVKHNGPGRAGFRCLQTLAGIPGSERLRVFLFTVLEREDLEANLGELPERLEVRYMPKSSDFSPLIAAIRKLTSGG